MGWMLVVSEDERFQREAIARCGSRQPIVGATGASSACGLVRAVDVETILVDALDDVGKLFLSVLRTLPVGSLPEVIVVDPGGDNPRFRTMPDLASAMRGQAGSTAA